ncbi:MAG: TadE family protein [Vicinamibacterales bacterium]
MTASSGSQTTIIRRRSERGAALVELAVALPLLLLIMVGTIDFGRAFRTAMIVTNAARTGAQFGSQTPVNATNTAGMATTANAVLTANGLGATPVPTASTLCQCASNSGVFTNAANCSDPCTGGHLVVSVTVTATRTFSLIQPFPGIPSSVTITRGATARAQ